MKTIDDFAYFCLLFDIYKGLLTEKQQNILEKHLYFDLSLNEISEEIGISRSGVLDAIEHGKENLKAYESKLHLAEKFRKLESKIEENAHLNEEEKKELIEEIYYGI